MQSLPARPEPPGLGVPTTLLRLSLSPERPWRPGPDLNTTLRGALGLAYRKMRCPTMELSCQECGIAATCLYATWYAPQGLRPFALRVVAGPELSARSPLVLELTLFGTIPAPEQLLRALREMAQRGLGRQRVPHSLRYLELRGATRSEGPSWSQEWPQPAALQELLPHHQDAERVRVTLLTPLQLSRGAEELDAGLLWATVRNRLRNLQRVYGQRTLAMLPASPELRTESVSLHRQQRSRHSRRQGQRVPLGGLVGELVISGELRAVLPALQAAELVQIGKATSTGLGQLRVEPLSAN